MFTGVMSDEQGEETTSFDADAAYNDGSYITAPDERLVEFSRLCRKIGSQNPAAIARFNKMADDFEEELAERKRRREASNSLPVPGVEAIVAGGVSADTMVEGTIWDSARVQALVDGAVEESLTLEYKGAPALNREPKIKTEITKDVSAMANSAGGVLIYGIAEDQGTKQLRLEPVNRTECPREWLEQVISNVRPRIVGLRISSIQVGASANEVVYVLEIPEGTTAHQATDFRYYRRYNFESVPMADHEIRDIMNRVRHPRIGVTAKLIVYPRQTRDNASGVLVVHVENKSDVLARYVVLVVDAPLRVQGNLVRYKDAKIRDGSDGSGYTCNYSNHNGPPLFPRATISPLFQFSFGEGLMSMPAKELNQITVTVFADSMPKCVAVFRPEEIFVQQ